jgi:hypothetical protein
MTNKKKTMGQKMLEAKTIIDNFQNQQFKEALKPYGYDEARINEGQVLYNEVKVLIAEKEQAYQNQFQATRELKDQSKIASDYFTEQAVIARKAVEYDKQIIKSLGILGRKKKAFADWTSDAQTFYIKTMADSDIMAMLARFGITEKTLKTGLALIEALLPLYAEQKNRIGMAQVSTPKKNRQMKALFKWTSDVIFCTRLASKILDPLAQTAQSKGSHLHGLKKKGDRLIKFEIRNPKSETNSKFKIPMTKTKKETSKLLNPNARTNPNRGPQLHDGKDSSIPVLSQECPEKVNKTCGTFMSNLMDHIEGFEERNSAGKHLIFQDDEKKPYRKIRNNKKSVVINLN